MNGTTIYRGLREGSETCFIVRRWKDNGKNLVKVQYMSGRQRIWSNSHFKKYYTAIP